jgi:hypothetical protein
MTIRFHKLPEVPLDPLHPGSAEQMRQLLIGLRQAVLDLRGPVNVPTPPSNFKATPLDFAVLLQWTQGINADGTEVLWNTQPTLVGANVIDVGRSVQHVDYVGNVNVKRFYWIRSYDAHAPTRSREVGPLAAMTLASGTGVTPPTPPPASQGLAIDPRKGYPVSRYGRVE